MAKPTTLDKIWASTGTIVQPDDGYINTGWTTDVPPYEYFNYAFNKWDEALQVLNTQGIFEWDSATTYSRYSKVTHNGIPFVSRTNSNTNNEPFVNTTGINVYDYENWKVDDGCEIGCMMLFDGNTPLVIDGQNVLSGRAGLWVDDSTMPGWYACVDGNQDKGCQNLTDLFIKGKGITLEGSKNGSHEKTLTVDNIPSHRHSVAHTHSASIGSSGEHRHIVAVPQGEKSNTYSGDRTSFARTPAPTYTDYAGLHNHSISISGASPNSSYTGNGTAFNIEPAHYTAIYIRKCY